MGVQWTRAENDFADHPGFVFGVGASGLDDFVDFGGVVGGDTRGVEVELALFLGEEFLLEGDALSFEGDALLVDFDGVEAMSDAGQDVQVWGVCVVGEVEARVGEFDPDVLEELFGIFVGEFVEFGLGEFLGVAAAAFGFEEVAKGFELDE